MSEPVLLIEKDAGVTTLTLNRPGTMNALSRALRRALADAFEALATDADTAVVVLTGAGRAFCAGLDLKELGGEEGGGAAGGAVLEGANLMAAMGRCPQPIIGAVNGVAVTGGFELALACDLLVASPAARFADTHARVGILPGWGLSQKLSRLVGIGRAKELSFTGNFLSADEAAAWGLVNRVVPAEALLPTCRKLAADMQSCVPEVLRAYKRVIDDGFAQTFADGLALERERNRTHAATITADQIAARRRDVQARGRSQTRE